MKPITNEDIKVLGRIVNISTENVVADASLVWDDNFGKDQSAINRDLSNQTAVATKNSLGVVYLAKSLNDNRAGAVVTPEFIKNELINGAPAAYDTLKEISDYLANNDSVVNSIISLLSGKVDRSEFDSLFGDHERKIAALESKVEYLMECCASMHQAFPIIKNMPAAIGIQDGGVTSVDFGQPYSGKFYPIDGKYPEVRIESIKVEMGSVDITNRAGVVTWLEDDPLIIPGYRDSVVQVSIPSVTGPVQITIECSVTLNIIKNVTPAGSATITDRQSVSGGTADNETLTIYANSTGLKRYYIHPTGTYLITDAYSNSTGGSTKDYRFYDDVTKSFVFNLPSLYNSYVISPIVSSGSISLFAKLSRQVYAVSVKCRENGGELQSISGTNWSLAQTNAVSYASSENAYENTIYIRDVDQRRIHADIQSVSVKVNGTTVQNAISSSIVSPTSNERYSSVTITIPAAQITGPIEIVVDYLHHDWSILEGVVKNSDGSITGSAVGTITAYPTIARVMGATDEVWTIPGHYLRVKPKSDYTGIAAVVQLVDEYGDAGVLTEGTDYTVTRKSTYVDIKLKPSKYESYDAVKATVKLKSIYDIDLNLTHTTGVSQKIGGSNSTAVVIREGQSYQITLVPNSGYVLDANSVEVKVGNATISAYNSSTNVISIPASSVTDDIHITAASTLDNAVTYGNVSLTVNNGQATGNSTVANGSYTKTITADSGYQLVDPVIEVKDSVTNEYLSYEWDETTGTFSITDMCENAVSATITLVTEPEQNVNRGYMYVSLVNARLQPDSLKRSIYETYPNWTGPDNVDPTPGGRTVYAISKTRASSYEMLIRPPYDAIESEDMVHSNLWNYNVTIDVRDIDGNKVYVEKDKLTNNFYRITGEREFGGVPYVALTSAVGSGEIHYDKDSVTRYPYDDPGKRYQFIRFKNIKSNKDLYVTITFNNQWMFTEPGDHIGHNNKAADDYVFSRELFSFNALGKYIDPLLPNNPSLFSSDSASYVFDAYGNPSYGATYREINIGKLDDIEGLTGSTTESKLNNLKSNLSFLFIKKQGLEGNVETKYHAFNVTETAETGCPFNVDPNLITLDNDGHVIIKVSCTGVDPTAGLITDTYTCPDNFTYVHANDPAVSFKTTTIDQHLRGSYHVSQMIVLFNGTPIYTTRLVREMYGMIACAPNRDGYLTTTTDVWSPNRVYFVSPTPIFTAASGDSPRPDMQIAIYNHGTQTVADTENMTAGDYIDMTMTITPVDNTYPALTSKLNNVDMIDGVPAILVNAIGATTSIANA